MIKKEQDNTIEVLNIGNFMINNHILKTSKGCIIIDTGYHNGFNNFKKRMNSLGIFARDIRFIFLTHAHDDHAGYLTELLTYTNAPVILHKKAVKRLKAGHNYLIGGCPSRRSQLFLKLLALSGKGEHKFTPVNMPAKYILVEGTRQPLRDLKIPVTILMLPGHTADSIGLLLDDGRLFCGDVAMNGYPSKARHPICVEDVQDLSKSWESMIKSKPVKIYPSHGRPFPPLDLLKYKNFLNNKKLYPLPF